MKPLRSITQVLSIIFLSLLMNSAYAQISVYDIPLDTIKQLVTEDPEEFNLLNMRCLNPDSVVTISDFFYLYYGSAYVEGYSPYGERPLIKPADSLLEANRPDEAIEYCRNLISAHPGFTRPYFYLAVAYDMKGDTTNAQIFIDRYYGLLGIPYYSGTGNSLDSAFVVRSVDDEYLIISETGYEPFSQALIEENNIPYDLMNVRSTETGEEKDMYFNVYQPYVLGLNQMFGDFKGKKSKKKKDKKKKKNRKKKHDE